MHKLPEIWVPTVSDRFIIARDNFKDLEIRPASSVSRFYYFFNKKTNSLIKQFILDQRPMVDYVCLVTLIKRGNKFTPRLSVSIRDKSSNIQSKPVTEEIQNQGLKANVNLGNCHENFWKLISFLQTFRDIEVPTGSFSLISQEDREIVSALQGRGSASLVNIIKHISSIKGVVLSEKDINQILKRKERLSEFHVSIKVHSNDESWWQEFFETNKWIFGYGLNYQILKYEQDQPHYGGTRVDAKGGQRGDFLASTAGDLNFTVLVEIKTPNTLLLRGDKEIRAGAWSLSKDLTDALTQIQANIDMWDKQGSRQLDNMDRFEKENVFTVQPKGIVVIGTLSELDTRSKRETFERFRKSLHGIDILTFDELLNRASFIVEEKLEENKES